jgi:hypothetical protein
MALQSFQLDPTASGVSQAEFDSHVHSYRKVTRIGCDDDDKFLSPVWVDVVDDADTVADTPVDLEAVGITVSTETTGVPA